MWVCCVSHPHAFFQVITKAKCNRVIEGQTVHSCSEASSSHLISICISKCMQICRSSFRTLVLSGTCKISATLAKRKLWFAPKPPARSELKGDSLRGCMIYVFTLGPCPKRILCLSSMWAHTLPCENKFSIEFCLNKLPALTSKQSAHTSSQLRLTHKHSSLNLSLSVSVSPSLPVSVW